MLYKPNKVMLEKIALAKSITANIKAKKSHKFETGIPLDFKSGNIKGYEMSSPDGNITAKLYYEKGLKYEVSFNGKTVIKPSEMGIKIQKFDLGKDVFAGKPVVETADVEYEVKGKHSKARDLHIAYRFPVHHFPTGLNYIVEFRLWNDGVGFRYEFPKGTKMLVEIENTQINMTENSVCYYQTDVRKMQSKTVREETSVLPDKLQMAYLVTFELKDNGYCILTESNLDNYPGAALMSESEGRFRIHFWDSGKFFVKDCVSPWRIAILANDLNSLVNNEVVKHAADPQSPIFESTDWIRPGKSAWSYFHGKDTSRKYKSILDFNTHLDDLGFDYSIIDSGWRKWCLTESWALRKVKNVIDKAPEGVDIWVWKSSATGPFIPAYRRWFLKKIKSIGAVGVKLDHIETETQAGINLYRRFLEDAAKNKLMVIYHNPNKPTGLTRTYPNLLSREAVRGLQCTADADENTIIPFTRFAIDGADYTPFCPSLPDRCANTTVSHALANLIVFTSPFMTIAEHPKNLKGTVYQDFFRTLPVCWDETIVMPQSSFGKLAAFARRKNELWYIGVQTNNSEGFEFSFTPYFLEDGRKYTLELFSDSEIEGSKDTVKSERIVTKSDIIKVNIKSAGGFAGRFIPLAD
ncbi:MAG: glycoside hydrolase family 97 protein [Clostridiales bacterium]|nr:glycoside hydrolase family 97 protein [Clostridiales bacterium]